MKIFRVVLYTIVSITCAGSGRSVDVYTFLTVSVFPFRRTKLHFPIARSLSPKKRSPPVRLTVLVCNMELENSVDVELLIFFPTFSLFAVALLVSLECGKKIFTFFFFFRPLHRPLLQRVRDSMRYVIYDFFLSRFKIDWLARASQLRSDNDGESVECMTRLSLTNFNFKTSAAMSF